MNVVHQQFGALWLDQRTDGSIWFSGKEVCDILGYKNDTDTLKKHVPKKNQGVANRYLRSENGVNQNRKITTIDESGLYRLILRSNKPEAEPFMEWITGDVIPTLRRNGRYETPEAKQQPYSIPLNTPERDQEKRTQVHTYSKNIRNSRGRQEKMYWYLQGVKAVVKIDEPMLRYRMLDELDIAIMC